MAEYDCLIISSGNSARLYSPELDFSGTGHELKFWMYHDDDYDTYADKVVIQVSTDESSWSNITEILTYNITEGWQEYTIGLSAYDGQPSVWIGFLGVSDYGYNNVYIDDVEITNAGGGSEWGELIDPITQESIDLAFVITGEGIPDYPPTACYNWVDADGSGPGTTIDFDASCSTDDLGITMYEWDWTNDGSYDYTGGPTRKL